MIGDAAGLRWATSLPLGVGRLTAEFVHDDPPTKADRNALEERVRDVLAPFVDEVRDRAPAHGRRHQRHAQRPRAPGGRRRTTTARSPPARTVCAIHVDQLERCNDASCGCRRAERRRLPGLEEKRAELLPAGVDAAGHDARRVRPRPVRRRRDDVQRLGAARRHRARRRRARTIPTTGRTTRARCAAPRSRASPAGAAPTHAHSQHVARLALSLFDQTQPLHGLGDDDREMLEYAALLHDIGQHVSRKGHHRHAAYLVENAQLRGFDPTRSSSSRRSFVTIAAASRRPRSRDSLRSTRTRASGCGSSRRSCASPTASTAAAAASSTRRRARSGPTSSCSVCTRTRRRRAGAVGRAPRRELFEKVFDRELEATVARRASPIARFERHLTRRRAISPLEVVREPDIARCDDRPHSGLGRSRFWVRPETRNSWKDALVEPDAPRAGESHARPHPRRRRAADARARRARLQHGRAREGGRRRARDGLRALPFEARAARRARVVDAARR